MPLAPFTPVKVGRIFWAALGLVLVGLAAYCNSFHGPFINDDVLTINNETVGSKHGWLELLSAPSGAETTAGRPVVNLSLALNYDWGGLAVGSYHVTNLAIHLLAGLVLFGLVRRTLELPSMRPAFDGWALRLGFVTALLWTLHPLETNSVTYVVQRAESLMGLFYLLALYCFVRAEQSVRANRWRTLAVAACLLSTLSKEVAVTIPVVIFLYDRTFIAGTFAGAWRSRWPWHMAMACTWLPLACIVDALGSRGETAGYGIGVSGWQYAESQFRTITTYLQLAVWPHPLQHDYGTGLNYELPDVLPYAVVVLVVVAATVHCLWYRPKLGFLGAWILIILAPTSSVMPISSEPIAEHRMYLPLAGVIMLAVVGLWKCAGQKLLAVALAMALAFGLLTFLRNEDYRTELRIWTDIISKSPDNAREHNARGTVLANLGRLQEAEAEFYHSLKFNPGYAQAENNLGTLYGLLGQFDLAVLHYKLSLRDKPDVLMYISLSHILVAQQHYQEARQQLEAALRLAPNFPEAEFRLGNIYAVTGQPQKALAYYQRTLELEADNALAYNNEGTVLLQLGRRADAVRAFEAALRVNPNLTEARTALDSIQPTATPAIPSP
jgi:Flp pilus assembly protein TadD